MAREIQEMERESQRRDERGKTRENEIEIQ
jgi:hypothetical protein